MSRHLLLRFSPILSLALFACAPSEGGTGAAGTAAAAGTGGGAAGTVGTQGTAGTSGAGTTGGMAGASVAGTTGGMAGTSGAGTTGNTAGTGGGAGTGATAGPACKAGATFTNTAGLNLKRTDIGARKLATVPAGNMAKMAWDPMKNVIEVVAQNGKFWTLDPAAAAPALTAAEANFSYGSDVRGMVFGKDGTLYVERGGGINVTIYKGTPGATRTWSVIASSDTFPAGGTNFDHNFSGMEISPDGMFLYFASGSRTDHGEAEKGMREVPLSSAIFRVPTNGSNIMLKNDDAMLKAAGYMFADGTRNTFDLAFNADGDLIGTENGPDADFPDEVNWIQEGKHYGFPWRFGAEANPVLDPAYTADGDLRLHTGYMAVDIKSYFGDAAFPPAPVGVTFVDPIINHGPAAAWFRTGKTGVPMDGGLLPAGMPGITGHRSPLGIAFDREGKLCGDFYKAGLILSYGSLPQSGFTDQGQDLLLVQLTKNAAGTNYEMKATQIATGVRAPMDGIMVGNKYYTVGYGNGNFMYEITLPTP